MKDLRNLPKGLLWVYCNHLPDTLTEEEFSDWFYNLGVDIPETHISLKANACGAMGAILAIPRPTLVTLLNWAINDTKLGGKPVRLQKLTGDHSESFT
jgi:hypothetical protein